MLLIDRVLGEGNFGKVCLATVSSVPIRDETQVTQDLQDIAGTTKLRRRLTIKRSQNNYATGDSIELAEPLLNDKTKRRVAVKMVKG